MARAMTGSTTLFRTVRALFVALALTAGVATMPRAALADDIGAASRSVVRVVTIAIVDQEVVGFGHGSGFAVAPNRIVTNAHVVELAQKYPDNVVIGVVPSEGSKSYQGKVIAIDAKRDLALIEFTGGSLPVATLFSGAVDDSMGLASLGYPGNVDVATAQSAADYIKPLAPVRSEGSLSASRTVNGVAAYLHSASISRGNSGGPLLDRCGRVLGVNSAIMRGEEGDANYAFAIAEPELAAFLRAASQPFAVVNVPCMSVEARINADNAADAAARETAEAARRDAAAREAAAREQAQVSAQANATRQAENAMAVAALLLVLGALATGGGGLLYAKGRQRPAIWVAAAGGVLILASIVTFVMRPSGEPVLPTGFDLPKATSSAAASQAPPATGKLMCKLVPDRSRITVSSGADVALDWGADGCMNGATQYAEDDGKWARILVPNSEQTVSVMEFDPAARSFTTYRYFLSAAQMDAARKVRAQVPVKACTAAASARTSLTNQQAALRAALPPRYSEKLVYACTPAP